MLHETKKPGAGWNQKSVIPNLNTHFSPTYLFCRSECFFILSLYLSLLLLFLFLLTGHTQTHTRTGLLIPSPSAVFQHAAGVTDD